MSFIKFGVVIEVPDEKGPRAWENLALNIPSHVQMGHDPTAMTPMADAGVIGGGVLLALRAPVFILGEILILNSDGREPHGRGRKPNKWGVTVQEFDKIEDALERSAELNHD